MGFTYSTKACYTVPKGALDGYSSALRQENICLPNGSTVSKNGPPTKTTICTAYCARMRRRNQLQKNLPLAFHFVCVPLPPGQQTKWDARGS